MGTFLGGGGLVEEGQRNEATWGWRELDCKRLSSNYQKLCRPHLHVDCGSRSRCAGRRQHLLLMENGNGAGDGDREATSVQTRS